MLLRDWLAAWRKSEFNLRSTVGRASKTRRRIQSTGASRGSEELEIRTLPSAYSYALASWNSTNPMYNRDLGTGARPTLADLDNDGDLDNLSGNEFGQFYYYRNTGTSTTPAFLPQNQVTAGSTGNPMRTEDVGDGSVLAWGDLDGDLDLDILVGNQQGLIRYYKNTGSASSPVFTNQTGAANPLNTVNVDRNAAPTLGDLDGDGDLDLVVGWMDSIVGQNFGGIRYFRNTGTSTSPAFTEQTGTNNPFNGVSFGSFSVPKPTLYNLDGDGDLDVVVGLSDGTLAYFKNTGSTSAPVFTQQTGAANPWNGITLYANPSLPPSNASPAFGDLDGDGDPDLLVGLGNGLCAYLVATPLPSGADLELTQTVDAPAPNVGTTVTYTVTLTNQGALNATGITVANPDPLGLSGITFTPSVGSYSAGVWTIPSLTASSSATLTISGTITAAGTDISNSAEVTASDQSDPDSTPNNHVGSEDDQTALAFHVNANPTLTVSGTGMLNPISTNIPNILNNGTLISDLIASMGPSGGITDPDSGPQLGIAINGTTGNSTGTWEYSINNGASWAAVGTVNNDGARLLAENSSTRIRYVPNNGFKGIAKIAFVAWDQSAGSNGGLGVTKFRTGSSPFSAAYDLASISVTNAAPVMDPSGTPSLDPISVNMPNMDNQGTLISDLIASMGPSGSITDSDTGSVQGIAINGLGNLANGTWEFTINGGVNWTPVGTTGNSDARLLAADPNTRLRFVPNPGYKGNASFAFAAWDRTSGSNGGTANVASRGGTTPYSLVYDYGSISVTNAAPVLDPAGTPMLDPISVNMPNMDNHGTLISDLIASMGPSGSITDSDTGFVQGIAINGLGNLANGAWEFTINDGTNWTAVGTTGNSNARLLAADPNTRLRFVPNSGFRGNAIFAFVAWDRTTGANGGTANVASRGGSTGFSSAYDYGSITVTNAAPVLTVSGTAHLDAIPNTISSLSNAGILVSDLIARMGPGGGITDTDPGAVQGIAIVGLLGESTGSWEYSTNDGASWAAVAATGSINARLLAANPGNRVRYVPNPGFTGQVKFAFVAWDQTTGVNGSLFNAGARGGTTAFSTLWDYATLQVIPSEV